MRYQRKRPGELIHIDVKKLGRIEGGAGKRITGIPRNPKRTRVDAAGVERKVIGWEYVHVCVDDATRAISHQPPLSRLRQLSGNNLLGSYT